jgi:hypothetical protein
MNAFVTFLRHRVRVFLRSKLATLVSAKNDLQEVRKREARQHKVLAVFIEVRAWRERDILSFIDSCLQRYSVGAWRERRERDGCLIAKEGD